MRKLSKNDLMLINGGGVGMVGYLLGANPPDLMTAVPPVVAVVLAFLLGVGITFVVQEIGK